MPLSYLLHMPSSVIMFWCIFCTVKENRCWFGNPFALSSVCLLGHNSIVLAALISGLLILVAGGMDDVTSGAVSRCSPHSIDVMMTHIGNGAVLDEWRKQSSRAPSVEDDEEGHLIYRLGDVLQGRCSWIHFVTLSNMDKS